MENFDFELSYYCEPNCHFEVHRYAGTRNIALFIVNAIGHQECVVSVNIENRKLSDDLIAIKNWSENEEIEALLKKQGVIEDEPVDFEPSGFVNIPIYKLTEKGKQIVKNIV